ncbi:MAG: polysaccharide biosynthesis C-terminal domain-containing protein [Solirubrobacteraceae bacterium]
MSEAPTGGGDPAAGATPESTPGAAPDPPVHAGPEDILRTPEAGGRVIRGSVWRLIGNLAGIALGVVTAGMLLHHLGVANSGRYVTVLSLVSISSAVADLGINLTSSRDLAWRHPDQRRALIANVLGLRLMIMPPAILLLVGFALVAGYPREMVIGTLLAGFGSLLLSASQSFLARLTVELRQAGWAVIDFLRQAVTLVCVAILVALGASLTPFFAVLIVTGLVVLAAIPVVAGRDSLVWPRFDRSEQRRLVRTALPMAIALALGEVYFRLVIVLMSLISTSQQTGYFGGSVRALQSLIELPTLIAAIALPLLATAAREDRTRLRYAVGGLGQGAVIAGVLLVLVTIRVAEPVMVIIGGEAFRPAGDVLRIQVGALVFIMLYQIWGASLLALDRQRELIFTNSFALAGLALFAALLIPHYGAEGGAAASVMGDALLAGLIYWRLQRATGHVMVPAPFLVRVAIAAAAACGVLLISALPDFAAAALAGVVFLGIGQLVGMIPPEVHAAFSPRRLLEGIKH